MQPPLGQVNRLARGSWLSQYRLVRPSPFPARFLALPARRRSRTSFRNFPRCSQDHHRRRIRPGSTEVWTWAPESAEATIKEALANLDKGLPPLPASPPEGAADGPLDVEPQVVVARVKGSVLWIKTTGGFSKLLLFNVAKPFWISQSKATPGTLVYVFGFGLRLSTPTLPLPSPVREERTTLARSSRHADYARKTLAW